MHFSHACRTEMYVFGFPGGEHSTPPLSAHLVETSAPDEGTASEFILSEHIHGRAGTEIKKRVHGLVVVGGVLGALRGRGAHGSLQHVAGDYRAMKAVWPVI